MLNNNLSDKMGIGDLVLGFGDWVWGMWIDHKIYIEYVKDPS